MIKPRVRHHRTDNGKKLKNLYKERLEQDSWVFVVRQKKGGDGWGVAGAERSQGMMHNDSSQQPAEILQQLAGTSKKVTPVL